MRNKLILIIINCACCVFAARNVNFKEIVDIQELVPCTPDNDINFEDLGLKAVGPGEVEVGGTINITKEIRSISTFKVDAVKCKSKAESETCEHITSFPIKDACGKINQKGQLWSSLLGIAKPTMNCPLFGVYDLTGGKIQAEKVKQFLPSIKDEFWKLSFHIIDENKVERACVKISFSLKQVRMRKP